MRFLLLTTIGSGEIDMTYREMAFGIAVGQHGYITTHDATESGIPPIELGKLASRGRLQHVAHGVYRFPELPPTKYGPFYEAILRVGGDARLSGDAVLALYELADVNPRFIRVSTGQRVRRAIPEWICITGRHSPDETVVITERIPTSTVGSAILAARPYVMTSRLKNVIRPAMERGLITMDEAATLQQLLDGDH